MKQTRPPNAQRGHLKPPSAGRRSAKAAKRSKSPSPSRALRPPPPTASASPRPRRPKGKPKARRSRPLSFGPPLSGPPQRLRAYGAGAGGARARRDDANVRGQRSTSSGHRLRSGDGAFLLQRRRPRRRRRPQIPHLPHLRAPDGSARWDHRGLLPASPAGSEPESFGWSEGLEDTYDFAKRPTEAPKLLRRSKSVGAAMSEVATAKTNGKGYAFAGASEGGAMALLERHSGGLLPGDLDGKQNLYAYDRATGSLFLAEVMEPDSERPRDEAMAGPWNWFRDGKNLPGEWGGTFGLYSTKQAISADGSRACFSAGGTGQLYVRVNPFGEGAELSPAQCRAASNTKACTIEISAPEEGIADPGTPAAFLGASADGRLVYFLDKGKLTAGATGGEGYDLYRYDLETGELIDLTPDATDKKGAQSERAVRGNGPPAGEDAFFVAAGALAEGASQAPNGETNLYALHGTAIEFIIRLGTGRSEAVNWIPGSKFTYYGTLESHASRLSADGQTLLFSSGRRLTSYDSQGSECVLGAGDAGWIPGRCQELYLYRAGQGISCLSCNPTGEAPTEPAGVQRDQAGLSSARSTATPS